MTLDFAPKLAEIPGSVLPLLLLSRLGYVPNIDKQNDEVLWVIRLSFSVGTRVVSCLVHVLCHSRATARSRALAS